VTTQTRPGPVRAAETAPAFPFRGVRTRPYDQDALPRERGSAPVAQVALADLWLTQHHLNIEGLFGKRYSRDSRPHVVRHDGELYVEDGHHRLVLAALGGQRFAQVRIIAL
jgi:hypothetical protein